MMKSVFALTAALAVGGALAGSPTSASARDVYPGCNCGPVAPSTTYKTIHPVQNLTRYHDRSVYRQVNRVRRIVNITQIQPIIRIHDITRIHHRTIVNTVNAYQHYTQTLAPITYVSQSYQHIYDCSCGQ